MSDASKCEGGQASPPLCQSSWSPIACHAERSEESTLADRYRPAHADSSLRSA